MNKLLTISIMMLLVLIPSVSALQQTAGAVNMSVEPGNSVTEKYGIRNDNNVTTTIRFNITGDVAKFITYEKTITLSPNEFRYVNIIATVPKDYSGNNTIKGIIYALEEGEKGGQVQLNIRLGKYIHLNVNPNQDEIPQNNGGETNNTMLVFTVIGVICIGYVVIKYLKK